MTRLYHDLYMRKRQTRGRQLLQAFHRQDCRSYTCAAYRFSKEHLSKSQYSAVTLYNVIGMLTCLETVLLVGGYASSPWLNSCLRQALKDEGMVLCRPESLGYVLTSACSPVLNPAVMVWHAATKQLQKGRYRTTCTISCPFA